MDVIGTQYGWPAHDALAAQVRRAKAGDPLRTVTVVVPSNYAGVAARRNLARRGGVAAVTFVTPYRLAELLAAPTLAAQGRRPVTSPLVMAALRRALDEAPGVLAPVADQAATVEALLRVQRELRDLDDPALDTLAARSARAAAVVATHRAAFRSLAPSWYDEADLASTALSLLVDDPSRALGFGTLVLHLPQDLSQRSARLLGAIGERVPSTLVIGVTGVTQADEASRRTLGALGLDALPSPSDPSHVAPASVVCVTDPDDEAREAVRLVVAAAEAGTPLERITLTYPVTEPYARLLADHLDAAGVAWNGATAVALHERIAGRAVLGLLRLAQSDLPRHELFGLLTSVPAILPGSSRPLPVSRWERLARRAGVVGGSHWAERLAAAAERLRSAHDQADDQADESGSDWRLRQAAELDRLAGWVGSLQERLRSPQGGWAAHRAWIGRLLDWLAGDEDVRATWPPDERRAADQVLGALDRLARLDDLALPVTLATFDEALTSELAGQLATVGHLGEGVFVAPLPLAVGTDAELVLMLGAAEGMLPPAGRDDPLLHDDERAAVGLATGEHRRQRLWHATHAARASARNVVVLRPRGNLRATQVLWPSRWLADLVPGADERHLASFLDGVRTAATPGTEQDLLLGRLASQDPLPLTVETDPVVAGDPALHSATRLVRARDSSGFTAYDGNLGAVAGTAGFAHGAFSPTRLEAWARCPFAYFARHVLGVREVERPEEVLAHTPLDRGQLIHDVLERFLAEALAAGAVPHHSDPWPPAWRSRLLAILHERLRQEEAHGQVGLDVFWQRDQRTYARWLEQFLGDDDRHRAAAQAAPIRVEVPFGEPRAPLTVELPGGRQVQVRGRIDRVDATPEGLLIIDFKSTRWSNLSGLGPHNPDDHGTRLQLPLYALAARLALARPDAAVQVDYWCVSDDSGHRPWSLTDDVMARLGTVIGAILDGIAEGVFTAHPSAPTRSSAYNSCWYCDPDDLGTASRYDAWERKRDDPALAPYLALVEPEAAP